MNKQQEALKLALEALRDYRRSDDDRVSVAMGILQEALAEQPAQQEPNVAICGNCLGTKRPHAADSEWKGRCDCKPPQPAQQQEPQPPYEFERYVAGSLRAQGVRVERATTLADAMRIAARICPQANPPSAPTVLVYTSPPASKPLTDEQIMEMYNEPRSDAEMLEFARAIEAAHGIGEQK